jgi:hypothetical protein
VKRPVRRRDGAGRGGAVPRACERRRGVLVEQPAGTPLTQIRHAGIRGRLGRCGRLADSLRLAHGICPQGVVITRAAEAAPVGDRRATG